MTHFDQHLFQDTSGDIIVFNYQNFHGRFLGVINADIVLFLFNFSISLLSNTTYQEAGLIITVVDNYDLSFNRLEPISFISRALRLNPNSLSLRCMHQPSACGDRFCREGIADEYISGR
jgi:hypothetical protein